MKKLLLALLYIFPVIIFFSYYPIIPISSSDSTNFELSLPIIWLLVFFCASVIYLPRVIKFLGWPKILLILALPVYATLSILWSSNPLRAFFTAALLALTFYAATMLIFLLKSPDSPLAPIKNLSRNLLQIFLVSATAICIICWLQCLLDISGLSREATLLCPGCTSTMFGFPHPNGFAIEPQFMGNLLLAPTLLTFYLLTKYKNHRRALTLLAFLFAATLFLTFSRGAIYAFALGLLAFLVYTLIQHRFLWRFLIIPVAAFCFTLCAQGLFAHLSPTTDTFTTGVAKVIHQLTLGKIDLRSSLSAPEGSAQPTQERLAGAGDAAWGTPISTPTGVELGENAAAGPATLEQPVFTGYVEDSTNIRVNLTNTALDLWNDSPTNIIFGTGLGSAGTVLYQNHKTASPKEIIQNQYASLLLELGLIGIAIVLALVILITKTFAPSPAASLLIPLVIAYAATLFFFAGLPNALQIYLLPPLFYACLTQRPSRHPSARRIPPNHKNSNSKSP